MRKSRSLNEADIVTNRRSDEEETIQTEDMSSSIRLNEKFEKIGGKTQSNLKGTC